MFFFAVRSECDEKEQVSLATNLPEYILSLPHGPGAKVPRSILKMVWISFAVSTFLHSKGNEQ